MSLIGTKINGYNFLEVLGNGQFGAVYKVEKNNNIYAAKLYHDHVFLREYREDNNRIQREIDILKLVNSDYLIKYYDDFIFKNEAGVNEYCVIIEFCNGENLTNYLKKHHLSLEEKIELFKQILNGVNDLHKTTTSGILHRDIKPDNIIIKNDGKVKIIDYGLAKLIDFTSITNTGARIGSPIFMSPEQFKDSKHIDKRADIYGLGVVFYYMLTDNYPYEAGTVEELIMKLNSTPIIPPTRFDKNIPHKLEKIIYKLLAKKLHLRYQTINKVLDDLNDDQLENFIFNNCFYPWCINEKTVIEKYLEENKDIKIIFPIHMKYSQRTLFEMIKKDNLKAIIDPSTHRLSYDTYEKVGGLTKLKYAPSSGIITLSNLQDMAFRREYLSNWLEEIKDFNEVILPYQYISNSNYNKESLEKWIQADIQLINESNELLYEEGISKVKYAMIALDINHLVYEKDMILSYYSSIKVDGIFVQVSGLKALNKLQLGVYVNFLKELQMSTNARVIALKVPVTLGLYLLACGIHGFSCGISTLEYFEEEFINKDRKAFNIYAKYYFTKLLSLATYARKEPYQLSPAYDLLSKCDCPYCKNRDFIDIAAEKNLTISLHFLHQICNEVKNLNAIVDPIQKLEYYKNRLEEAIKAFEKLNSNGLKQIDQYELLKVIYSTL